MSCGFSKCAPALNSQAKALANWHYRFWCDSIINLMKMNQLDQIQKSNQSPVEDEGLLTKVSEQLPKQT